MYAWTLTQLLGHLDIFLSVLCGALVELGHSATIVLHVLLFSERALCLPTFSHFLTVNKTSLSFSLSLFLSLSLSLSGRVSGSLDCVSSVPHG